MRPDTCAAEPLSGVYTDGRKEFQRGFHFCRFGYILDATTTHSPIVPLGLIVELYVNDGWVLTAVARKDIPQEHLARISNNWRDIVEDGSSLSFMQKQIEEALNEERVRRNHISEDATLIDRIHALTMHGNAHVLDSRRSIQGFYLSGISDDRSLEDVLKYLPQLLARLSADPFLRSEPKPRDDLVPA